MKKLSNYFFSTLFCCTSLSATYAQEAINDASCDTEGFLAYELYYNIGGSRVDILTSNPRYGVQPSFVGKRYALEGDTNVADAYGSRMVGYLCPPQTGLYTFYLAADDRAQLWLSTDEAAANKQLLAEVNVPKGFREYFVDSLQRSVQVGLLKGNRYYVEVLHKEGSKSDHVSVAWTLPDGSFEAPISGNRLSPAPRALGLDDALAARRGTLMASPNPATSSTTLSFWSSQAGTATVSVLDAYAHELLSTSISTVVGATTWELPLASLPEGILVVQVRSATLHLSHKLVIQK